MRQHSSLAQRLQQTPYVAYTYAYPHKTAYRTLEHPVALHDLWASEQRNALFLYFHIPFCEMRCGFCNLFTTANPPYALVHAYMHTLQQQAQQVRAALGAAPCTVARMAIGGGTPTSLAEADLHTLFDIAEHTFGVDPAAMPVSVEVSPATATASKLQVLRMRGVDRISIGVQSFSEAEVAASGRSQRTATVMQALEHIRAAGFPTLNIDLMYGLPGQTPEQWRTTLQAALRCAPEELYLYPLYVRPRTGLARRGTSGDDDDTRLACYRAGRDLLLQAGYTQHSMRLFRAHHAPAQGGPLYCCQEDGMIGLGCGARSYTRALHYASEYAVSVAGVRALLQHYLHQPPETFALAQHGYRLDHEEQCRRYIIKSLLKAEGLHLAHYHAWHGSSALQDVPELDDLLHHGMATLDSTWLRLTAAGLERSDTIGPWLYSERVQRLIEEYHLQ